MVFGWILIDFYIIFCSEHLQIANVDFDVVVAVLSMIRLRFLWTVLVPLDALLIILCWKVEARHVSNNLHLFSSTGAQCCHITIRNHSLLFDALSAAA